MLPNPRDPTQHRSLCWVKLPQKDSFTIYYGLTKYVIEYKGAWADLVSENNKVEDLWNSGETPGIICMWAMIVGVVCALLHVRVHPIEHTP